MDREPIVGSGEEGERPKPRVVDRRVGSRPPSEDAPTAAPPAPAEPTPAAEPEPAPAPADQPLQQPVSGGHGPEEVWTPEAEEQARAIAEEIVKRPGIEWVVNSAVSLANIAATKLEMGSAADARIVIDALAGILTEVGDQLGNVEQPLRQTLAQLQMAYADGVAEKTPPLQ